jgi:hypothetical protein
MEPIAPWLVLAADAHPPGFGFAVGDAAGPLLWCRREIDARFLAEAQEAAAEIVELADPGFDRLDEPRRRRIRALVARAAPKGAIWTCRRPETHPADFPLALAEEDEVIGYARTPAVAAFAIEAGVTFQDLAAITQKGAMYRDEDWTRQETATVITLAGRLRRRLRALSG